MQLLKICAVRAVLGICTESVHQQDWPAAVWDPEAPSKCDLHKLSMHVPCNVWSSTKTRSLSVSFSQQSFVLLRR